MSLGIFESLAADDSDDHVALRQATAVANKRVNDRFGAFLAVAKTPNERTARLEVVRGDIQDVIASACNEYGGDQKHVETSIFSRLAAGFSGSDDLYAESPEPSPVPTQPDFDEALNDHPETINLEPNWDGMQAWLDSVAQTDPEVAQGIAEASGGKLQLPQQGGQPFNQPFDPAGDDGPNSVNNQLEDEFGGAYSSVRTARRPKMCPYHSEVTDISLATGDPSAGFNTMSQHAWGPQHCKGEYEGGCNFSREMVTQEFWDARAQQAQERKEQRERERAIEQEVQETEVPESPEGLDSTEPALDPGDGPSIMDELADAPSAVGTGEEVAAEPTATLEPMAAATKEAEAPRDGGGAVKTVEVDSGSDTASPEMDKSKIPADGLPEVDSEQEGSPHPTVTIDPLEPIAAQNDEADFLEGTKAVSETQKVDQASSFDGDKADSGSWAGNNNASPVTSASVDPDANPIQRIVEEDFASPSQVEAAIKAFNDAS